MKSCLIVYYSLNHSTEKIAEKISAGLRQAGLETTLCNIKDKTCPDPLDYDLLGIGSPVYAFQIPMNVMSCLERFPDLNGKKTFAFLTHGSYMLNAGDMLKRGLQLKNAQIQGWYYSFGADYFLPYNKQGCLPSYGHPSPEELDTAQEFGLDMGKGINEMRWLEVSRHPSFMYRMEQFLCRPWFVRNIYQKLFHLNKDQCIQCGLCIENCPAHNIHADAEGYPKWEHRCIMCLECEKTCPQEAISSVVNGPIMKPFINYNVKQIMNDPELTKVQVKHHHGKTEIV